MIPSPQSLASLTGALSLAFASLAAALSPVTMTHQGYLVDREDKPVTASELPMRFTLHTHPNESAPA